MAEFLLQPFRHRAGRLAPDRRQEPLVLTTEALFEKFSLNKEDKLDQIRVQHMRVGSFVGISLGRVSREPVCFVLDNPGKSHSYAWILKSDPSFDERIQEVYKIERATWDSSIEEVPT